jgi:hypothetical protein
MKDAGFEDRIRDIYTGAPDKPGIVKRMFIKAYMGVMIVAVIASTVIISRVIYESVFVLGYQIVSTEPAVHEEKLVEPAFIEEVKFDSSKGKEFFRGFRFVKEKQIKNHYHRIELDIVPDKISLCIKCHGDLPHGNSPHVRAFLNMHNLYLACETCHVRTDKNEGKLHYYWYNRSTGQTIASPDIGDKQIDSMGIKLTPCVTCDGVPTVEQIESERILAENLMTRISDKTLSGDDKKEIVQKIHERISKQPVVCSECHNRKNPFLNLSEIGYPDHRIKAIANDQITKLVTEYKDFHTPAFLEPGNE